MANVKIDVHVTKYMLDKSVIVEVIILELMVFAVKDVLLIKFGTDNNVFALKGMLWWMEFVENVSEMKNITVKQIHANVKKDSIG